MVRNQKPRGSFLWAYVDAILQQNKLIKEGFKLMANSFDNMTAAVDRVADQVRAVADAIANPAVDNNDQAVIDDLTIRLNAAADALETATAAENAEDAGPAPTPTP